MRKLANDRRRRYEVHEFTIPSPTNNVSINAIVNHLTSCSCARATGFGGVVGRVGRVDITNRGDGAVTVRMTASTADPLTIEDGERFNWDFNEIDALGTTLSPPFFTNTSGFAVPVRVLAA